MIYKLSKLAGILCLSSVSTLVAAATSNVDVYGMLSISIETTSSSTDSAFSPWNPTVTTTFKSQLDALTRIGWSTLHGIVDDDGFRAEVTRNLITGDLSGRLLEDGGAYGDTFSGYLLAGSNPGAYLDTLISNAETIAAAGAATFTTSRALTGLALTGAHHRPLMSTPFPAGGRCMWLTGDFSHNQDGELQQELGELGVCKDFADGSLRIGAGVGASRAAQRLALGGELQFSGQHLLAEVDYRTGNNLLFSLIGVYGRGDTDVRRNYLSLITPPTDTSLGSTETSTFGARIRLDWLDVLALGQGSMTPYVAYTQIRTRQDRYSETGGSSPAQYDAVAMHTKEVMTGVTAKLLTTANTNLSLSVEAIRRINADDTPSITGLVVGLSTFSIPGAKPDANYMRLGLDIDYQVSRDSMVAVSAHVTDIQPGPTWSGSISWRMGF
jgi:hypothetical protein